MIVVLAADHAGVALKDTLLAMLSKSNILTLDFGTRGTEPVDYPDFADRVCDLMGGAIGPLCVGVLICGSGIGMSIAANRYRHVRCVVATTVESAQLARRHNNANVLALGARVVDDRTACAIMDRFLSTSYEGGRHDARLAKLS